MHNNYIPQDSDERKRTPMAAGLLDYFPAALAAVAAHSYLSNEKHNPGQPLHWSRQNSTDHADCIVRHLVERGGFEAVYIKGDRHTVRHSAALAWRALALLQEELEAEGMTPGRASRFPPDETATGKQLRAEAMANDPVEWMRGSQWLEMGLDDLAKARGHKHAQPLTFNKLPSIADETYDVKVVADKDEDAETAKVLEGLFNYWRHDGVGKYALTPAGLAELKKPVRKKKRAVPKPARKRK